MEDKLKKLDIFIDALSLISDIRKRLDRELTSGLGITFNQFYILRFCLSSAKSQKELAHSLALTEASVSGLVAKLSELCLVEQKPDSNDRRKSSVFLTADGRKKVKIANLLVENELSDILSALSSDQRDLINYLKQ